MSKYYFANDLFDGSIVNIYETVKKRLCGNYMFSVRKGTDIDHPQDEPDPEPIQEPEPVVSECRNQLKLF